MLDLYRYSATGVRELTFGGAPYFSLNSGTTNLALFSTGAEQGDGRQASHWKDNLGIGIMDPTSAPAGQANVITARDIQAFDVIGWNLAGVASDDFADSFTDLTAPFGNVFINGSTPGNLETLGDRDWFRVQLFAGNTYTIQEQAAGAGVGTLDDAFLRLHNSAGTQVAVDDDSGPGRDSLLTFTPSTSGTYYLNAGGFNDNETGTYRVSVSGPPASSTLDNDFNGDLKSDILWQNNNGTPAIWLLDGFNLVAGANVGFNPGTSWKAINSDDFNGDGRSDILWQNDNGQAAVWLVNGTTLVAGGNAGPNPGTSWHARDAADFNGDGAADILWQNDNGQAAVWIMNGTSLISGANVGPNPGTNWNVIGAGDFNGDNLADILWQNDNGQAAVWLMNGQSLIAGGNVGPNVGSGWNAQGAGDFNGDGRDDILWQNDSGQAAVWLLSGLSLIAGSNVGPNPGTAWDIQRAGDYNGDGRSDILWQNDSGQPAVWLLDGFNLLAGSNVGPNPGTSWNVIPPHHDLV